VAATPTPIPGATVPPPAPDITPSTSLPDDVSPNGPILAAYTTFATYNVRRGDTLRRVATDFGVTVDSIQRASGLLNPNLLIPGQVLTIPRESGWLYRVQTGETLDIVALRFGISPNDLIDASTLNSANVRPGDVVFIPNSALAGTKH